MVKNVKEMQDEQFNWFSCPTNRDKAKSDDITIKRILSGGKPCINLTFRNDIWEIIGESIEFAIFKNRVVFREKKGGLELKPNKNSKNRYAFVGIRYPKEVEALSDFIGDYSLNYDGFYEVYYIEREG